MEQNESGISTYAYVLIQYALGRKSAAEVRFLSRFWLTPQEAEDILRLLPCPPEG